IIHQNKEFEKRRSSRKSGKHRKRSDTSSGGSFLDENDREVSSLTDRAFKSLCIGDEAVYNDSHLGLPSSSTHIDRQLAFAQDEPFRDEEEREELKRAAHQNFSLRVQQYGQDWVHEGMYGTSTHKDPEWGVYGDRTQGRVSATFQNSFVETSQQGMSLREEELSFISNGATELSLQHHRSRSRVSSLIRTFNSEVKRNGANINDQFRGCNVETNWDKSALMNIHNEFSDFSSSYQQNLNSSSNFPSAGPFSCRDDNFYSSDMAAVAHMSHNSVSSFMRSSHNELSMSAQANCNSPFFIHSEFSPFKVWREHNRFPFQQREISGFMHCSQFPKWYETPMYKELSLENQLQGPYRGMRHSSSNLAPRAPSNPSHFTSMSLMQQKASAVEKRSESELAGHYPQRRRTQTLGTNKLPCQRPSTASPTVEMSRRVRDTISSVKALQQKIKVMSQQNISAGVITTQQESFRNHNLFQYGNNAAPKMVSSDISTTPFTISQLPTPSVTAHQEENTSGFQQHEASPQPVEHPPVRAESRGVTPDARLSSYKSRATSLLFNLKDNRKRVKSTYSPTKFKGLDKQEKNQQPLIQEPRETVIDVPDCLDPDIQFLQQENSRSTIMAANQYQNPALTLETQLERVNTGQYLENTSTDYQTAQVKAAEEQQRKLFQEEQHRKAAEEQQRKLFQEEQQRKAAEEQQRKLFQEEQQRKAAEEQQRKLFQEEQQRKAAEEQQRKLFQEEQQRKPAEEQQRTLFQEEQQRRAKEEQQRKLFQEKQQRKPAEEQQRKLFQEEQQRKAAEEQHRKLFQEEQQRRAKEEQQRKLFQEKQQRKAAEEQQRKLFQEEQQRKAAEEQQRKLFQEEQQRKAAEEQHRKLFQEEQQRRAKEEQQRKLFQEKQQRKAAEEQQRKLFQEEQQRKAAEEQQRKLFQEEQQRKAAEEQQRKLFQEEQQRKAAEGQQRKHCQDEKQRQAETEQQIRRLQEKQQRKAAEEHQKITTEGRQGKCFQKEQERGAAKEQEKTIALEDKQHRTIEKKQITPQDEHQNVLAKEEDLSRVAEQIHESTLSKKVYKKEHMPEQEKEEQQIEKLRRRRSLNHTLMKTKEEGVMAVDEKETTLKPEEKLVQDQSAKLLEEKIIAGDLIQEKSKKKEENLAINRGKTGVSQAEIQKQTQKMDGLQYYAFTSTDMEVKSREKRLSSLLRSEQRSSPVRLDSPDDSIIQTKSSRPLAPASPAPSLPRSNTSSPALGTKPSMFKVKDNTIRSSSFIKSVKPRFHKNFGDDFLLASTLDRSLEKVDDERERIKSGAGTPVHTEIGTKQFSANTEFSTLFSSSAQDYSFSHHRPYSRRSIALDDDESRSVISNLSEDVESYATSAADVGDVRGLLDFERPESACSFSSDVSRSLGKPPVVPPKTEKALRRAQRLTSRRMKKELSKVSAGGDKETSSVPSSSTETHQSNNDAVASPHFSQPVSLAHTVSNYHVESSCFSQSYPMTQRKVLQDLGSGQYYVVDVPVQVQTKTFFDPETGKYVQLNHTQLHQTKLQPQPFTQTPTAGKPFVLYQRYHSYPQNYQPTANTPVRRSRSSAPGSLQQNHESLSESKIYGNMANEVEQNSVEPCYSPERTPYMDTVIDTDKTHNSVKSTQNPMESASECGTKNQTENHETSFQYQGRDIITMSELEDFMEATEW
uniref:DUF4585 domain-containing protein n=1 Tax=Oryzias latipes TaxID=8090 RepID=A0A3B3I7S2_ORYLA